MTTTLLTRCRVADFDVWRPRFEAFASGRAEILWYRIWRGADDPNLLVLLEAFDTSDAADALLSDPALPRDGRTRSRYVVGDAQFPRRGRPGSAKLVGRNRWVQRQVRQARMRARLRAFVTTYSSGRAVTSSSSSTTLSCSPFGP